MEDEVRFDYFYRMFLQENQKILLETIKNRIGEDEEDIELMLMFPNQFFTKEEILEEYDKSLLHICENYIFLSNSKMNVFPNNSFEFVVDILDEIEENPYRYSFLSSLQFIYQEYLGCLGVGSPVLKGPLEKTPESYMEITLNSRYQITDFDFFNMDLLEKTKTMTKFVMMQKNQQIGPLPKVKYYYRKDI